LVSTAGAEIPGSAPGNIYLAQYLPGEDVVKMSSLVICNGGSPTTHQALVHGVPVLGLAGNLDQYLNMATCERAGAGRLQRAGAANSSGLVQVITQMLEDPSYRQAAMSLAENFADYNSSLEFCRIINEVNVDSQVPG
jgi:UDP:flavonoid glycosyltransferase YjiC (YdhE family)